MDKEELTNVFKYIVKMCDRLINNGNYEADAYTQDTVEDIAELCNRILDGDYGKLVEVKEVQEEPVSEDLEDASKEWLIPQLDKSYTNYGEAKMMELTHFDGYAMLDAIEFGARWKEMQFEKNRLTACDAQTEEEAEIERDFVTGIIEKEHRQPTFDDAIKYGMRLQKEQMIAEAIDGEVKVDAGGYPYIDKTIELYDYGKDVPLAKAGEKVRVLVIKED